MEYTALFLVLSTFLFFPLMYLKRFHFNSILELNYFSIWFYVYILFGYLGALITLMGGAGNSYFISGILYNELVVNLGSYFILWSGLGMFYGFIIFLLIFDRKFILKWDVFVKRQSVDVDCEYIVILFFCIVSFFSFCYYQLKVYPNPLILAFQGDVLGAALRRIEITKDLNKIANTYVVAFGVIIAQIFSIQLVLRNNKALREKILKFIMILLSFSFLLTTSEKAPILFYLFSIYMAYAISLGKVMKVNVKITLYSFFSILAIYYIFVSKNLLEIKNLIFERVFFAQMAVVYYSFDYYNYSNFIGFSSLGGVFNKIFELRPVPPYSEVLLKFYFNEMLAGGGWNINGIYIAEAWSNFGYLGAILSPIYVGVVLATFYIILFKIKGTFGKALMVFFTTSSFSFLTSLNLYIYNTNLVLIIIIILFKYLLIRLLKK